MFNTKSTYTLVAEVGGYNVLVFNLSVNNLNDAINAVLSHTEDTAMIFDDALGYCVGTCDYGGGVDKPTTFIRSEGYGTFIHVETEDVANHVLYQFYQGLTSEDTLYEEINKEMARRWREQYAPK